MVEMLGVLAVIGVLSVVGIAGFKNAMDKNKANTIINEAQKRATLVVPQIQLQNSTNPTLNEFSNNNLGYAEFDTKVYTKADNLPEGQFGIKVSDVSKEVCQNILNTLGDNKIIRRLSTTDAPTTALTTCGETNTFLMVYNNDMSINEQQECNGNGYLKGNSCTCYSGYTGENCELFSCENNQVYCGDNAGIPLCCSSDSICTTNGNIKGNCYKNTSGCTTNEDCSENQYCKISATRKYISGRYCSKITGGSCQPIGTSETKIIPGFSKPLIKSGSTMTSLAAKNWCAAIQKRQAVLEELNCYVFGTSTPIKSTDAVADTPEKGFCCAINQSCAVGSEQYQSLWSDATTPKISAQTEIAKYSQNYINLRKNFGDDALWLGSDYGNDGCFSFMISLQYGNVWYHNNPSAAQNDVHALCE